MITLTREEAQRVLKALETLRAKLIESKSEPVAYMDSQGFLYNRVSHPENYTALYTSPSQHKWVGLTTDEVFELSSTRLTHGLFAKLIEAKLKEKNNG